MIYVDFRKECLGRIKEEYKTFGWSIKLYLKGDTSDDKEELDFIHQTNLKYFGYSKDVLDGDFYYMTKKVSNNSKMMSRFEVSFLYDEFKKEGWNKVDHIVKINITSATDSQITIGNIDDYDSINNMLIVRPVRYKENEDDLKEMVFRQIGDFALVLYMRVSDDKQLLTSFKISQEVFKNWGKSEDEVFDRALENSSILYPEAFTRAGISMKEIIVPELGNMRVPILYNAPFAVDGDKLKRYEHLTVTCPQYPNGAVSFFYPRVKDKLNKVFDNEDCYVIFLSIAGFAVHSYSNTELEDLVEALKDNNERFPQDTLTNYVYVYRVVEDKLEPVMV